MTAPFRLSAIGDIAFEGPAADRPSLDHFAAVADVFRRADVTVGNLECALTDGGVPIAGKCTLRGTPGWADVLQRAGVGVVSLANNHVMDFGPEGLVDTTAALERAGVGYVGAGRNRQEACAPLFVTAAGRTIAFLARSSVIVTAPTYAGEAVPGVAFLDPDETRAAIRSSRARADVVVLLIHWGIEEYAYPSATQRNLAKQFIDAGADVVLGHHPHVLQGIEEHGAGVVAYSLGNFLFDEFEWWCMSGEQRLRQFSALSADNRKGAILTLEWAEHARPAVSLTPTLIDAHGCARVDREDSRAAEFDALSAGLRARAYRARWCLHAARREWALRCGDRFSLHWLVTNLHRIRPRHFGELGVTLYRSLRMVSERSTNPYE
jgi:Bacterial capsule synthesis protein PGA_cap